MVGSNFGKVNQLQIHWISKYEVSKRTFLIGEEAILASFSALISRISRRELLLQPFASIDFAVASTKVKHVTDRLP